MKIITHYPNAVETITIKDNGEVIIENESYNPTDGVTKSYIKKYTSYDDIPSEIWIKIRKEGYEI
tara:strand:- start:112 stop:306 length:195 start_codon:yes stop_codon:yes gene_type:complete